MRFALRDHYGKGSRLAKALEDAGHIKAYSDNSEVDLFLTDLDVSRSPYGYGEQIELHKQRGTIVMLYPHGAGPVYVYDGMMEPSRMVDLNLVNGVGQAELLRRIAYPQPVMIIGWYLCEMQEFTPRPTVRNILFAPIHPSGDGFLCADHQEANRKIFEELTAGPWKITVRLMGRASQNGIWKDPKVKYVQGNYEINHEQIDQADVVVAGEGTFPALALARGVPTIMYGQDLDRTWNYPGAPKVTLRNPENYRDYCRYPLDASEGNLPDLIERAAAGDIEALSWADLFVGDPFHEARFVSAAEEMVANRRVVR